MSNLQDNQFVVRGRIVQGDLFNAQERDQLGNVRDKPQWFVGLAIPKTSPDLQGVIGKIQAIAARDMPNDVHKPNFAWKVVDGDTPDNVGKPGFAGHMVLRLTSGFAPDVYGLDNKPIIDPRSINRGDYVMVMASIKGNGSQQTPGVYLNLNMARFAEHGEAIISGPSADDVFGAAQQQPMQQQPMQQQPMQQQPMQQQPMQQQPMQQQPMQQQPMQQQPMQQQPMQQQPMQQQPMQQQPMQDGHQVPPANDFLQFGAQAQAGPYPQQ